MRSVLALCEETAGPTCVWGMWPLALPFPFSKGVDDIVFERWSSRSGADNDRQWQGEWRKLSMPVKLNMDICLPRGSKSNVWRNGGFSSWSATWIMSWNTRKASHAQNSGGQHFHSSIKIIFKWVHRPDSCHRQPLEHLQTVTRALQESHYVPETWTVFSELRFHSPSAIIICRAIHRPAQFTWDSGWFLLQCRQIPILHSLNFSGPLFSPIQLVQRLCSDISIGSTVSSWVSNNKKTYHLDNLHQKNRNVSWFA